MKALAITHKGCEDICQKEIEELSGSECKAEDSAVLFEVAKKETLFEICYRAQSVSKIMILLGIFNFKKIDDLKKIEEVDIKEFVNKKTKMVVRCRREGEHGFNSNDIEKNVGEYIINNAKKNNKFEPKVDLENPDVIFFVYVNGKKAYFGVDLCGFELDKREYKIFNYAPSIKGTMAYCLLRFAGVEKDSVILDPFCHNGTIAIEAALFFNDFPVNYYRKEKFNFKFDFKKVDNRIKDKKNIFALDASFNSVNSTKKNAKVAGVNKNINFSRTDVEWLDLKKGEKSIDAIVTMPPEVSRTKSEKEVEKLYKELFYQAEYILKKDGVVAVVVINPGPIIKCAGDKFKVKNKKEVWSGKQKYWFVVIEKKSS